jgi:hypothetical protein
MLFELRQRLMMPKGIGFNGVQCFVTGREESLDAEPNYHISWIDDAGQIGVGRFTQSRLVAAQKDAIEVLRMKPARKKRSRKKSKSPARKR